MGTTVARGAGAFTLVLLMAAGSILMWIGVPIAWLYIASRIADSGEPSMGLYVGVLVAIAITMAIVGKLLGLLNRWHMALTDSLPQRREQTVWLKSMRGDASARRQHGILGTIMAISVAIALTLMGLWFFLFAEGGGI